MTDEKKPAETEPTGADAGKRAPDEVRRKLAKAALAAPVIMTLGSRPVWGQTCSPSAVGSLTHASHVPGFDPELCTFSCPASRWYSAISWPVTTTPGAPFSGLFSGSMPTCTCNAAADDVTALWLASLSDVLSGTPSGISNSALRDAAKELVAAVLNARFADALNSQVSGMYDFFPKTEDMAVSDFLTALEPGCGNCGEYNKNNNLLATFAITYSGINSSGTCFLSP